MNIYLNTFYNYSISYLKEKALPVLTHQQKKILIIASLAFGCIAACLIAKRFCFKDDSLNDQDKDSNDSLTPSKPKLSPQAEKEIEEKETFEDFLKKNQDTDSKIKKTASPILSQKETDSKDTDSFEEFDDEFQDSEKDFGKQSEEKDKEDLNQGKSQQHIAKANLKSPIISPSIFTSLSSDQMKTLWENISESSNTNPFFFNYDGNEYAIWKGLRADLKIVNIQLHSSWKLNIQKEKIGFGLDDNFSINSQRIDNQNEDTIPLDRQHLLDALNAYAKQGSILEDEESSEIETEEILKIDSKIDPLKDPSTTVYPIHYSTLFKPQQLQEIQKIRQPLTNELKNYFDLDTYGYIFQPKSNLSLEYIEKELAKKEKALAQAFYQVSHGGDAAYADDIRTILAGLNIASHPVDKDANEIEGKKHDLNSTRPVSYVKSKSKAPGKKDPGIYKTTKKSVAAYIDVWGNAIWKGNRDYRHSLGSSYKTHDKKLTPQQMMDYHHRLHRIRVLHKEGLLLGRVANTAEVRDFIGHRYQMGNDILSTTLWPKEHDPVIMQLFSEYGTDTVGLLLDHTRAGSEDFGVSFQTNALTVGQGFQNHKARRKGATKGHLGFDGAHSILTQKELLEALSTEVKEGGAVSNLEISLSDDGSHYKVKKIDARAGGKSNKNKKVLWNEQTFYRGIEKDFFTGLFVKSDSDSFSKELKALFELQDRIRRKRGMYVPIFQFKGSSNELEELVPDNLLLSITGTKGVTPIEGRTSRFSQELQKAGITEEMALKMSLNIIHQGEVFKSLFELQLLMFNMKDIMGAMTVPVKQSHGGVLFKSIRILDNLHLVFPTIHKTQNSEAKQPDAFFSDSDLNKIKSTPALLTYLQLTLSHNFERFLGITVNGSNVKFDSKNADLFVQNDAKKSDFAKVLSRAVQSAILFQIYGKKTNQTVSNIIIEIRKTWPTIGMTPGGIDMILGSAEMQAILTKNGFKKDELSLRVEPAKSSFIGKINVPQSPYKTDAIDPFNPVKLPNSMQVKGFLAQLGIDNDGSIDDKVFDLFKASDPHLFTYETTLVQTIQMLYIINEGNLAQSIMKNMRNKYPEFGVTVTGDDISSPKSDVLMRWLQESLSHQPHQAEFPFQSQKTQSVKISPIRGRGRFAVDDEEEEEDFGGGRFARRALIIPNNLGTQPVSNEPQLSAQDLQKQVAARDLIPAFSADQIRIATLIGLIDSAHQSLWTVVPTFHGGDTGKPVKPYIAIRDLLGHYAPYLMTGPAFEKKILEKDRDSFELAVNPKIVSQDQIERLVTHTLAMTTEGDKQLLRPNGLQYSQSINPPMGGNIEFNGGNEKHRFRSNDSRKFHENNYGGMGAYSNNDLKKVEDLDKQLLSDQERRIKRAGLLASGYVTVTAEGGFGSERKPLDRAYRVLYMATAGAQFEKYDRKSFTYQDGTIDENELEASDFIIKKNATTQKTPLFPHYYSNGKIPAHKDILPTQCSKLNDGNFAKPYVELIDGALFNRHAFQRANDDYLLNLVIPTITQRMNDEPFYLKAILAGGGFFAQTDHAGNLRSEVIHATLKSYIKAIDQGLFSVGSVIEFPRYGEQKAMPNGLMEQLQKAAIKAGIELVWTPEGDVCDFKQQTSLNDETIDPSQFEKNDRLVVLGAADAMSWHGNEPSSASVEACFANNSNLRLVMNWWANPRILEVINEIATA